MKLNIKVRTEEVEIGLMHKISIKNITIGHLDNSLGNFIFECKRKNDKQLLEVKIIIKKSLITKKVNLKRSMTTIIFEREYIHANLANLILSDRIIQTKGYYVISYNYVETNDVSIDVTHTFKRDYFENRFKTNYEPPKVQEIQNKQQGGVNKNANGNAVTRNNNSNISTNGLNICLPKSVKIGTGNNKNNKQKMSPEDLMSKDFRNSDQFTYNYSPNSDGLRSKMEFLGGSGSNMFRRKK